MYVHLFYYSVNVPLKDTGTRKCTTTLSQREGRKEKKPLVGLLPQKIMSGLRGKGAKSGEVMPRELKSCLDYYYARYRVHTQLAFAGRWSQQW